jgi:hypothetical protein
MEDDLMRAPLPVHRFALTLVALITCALPVGHAAGSAPTGQPVTVQIDDEFVESSFTAGCGFEVIMHVNGSIRVTEDPETGDWMARYALKRSLTGRGGSLSFPDDGLDKVISVVIEGDIAVLELATHGVLPYQLVVPGYGPVAANIGRDLYQFTINLSTGEESDFVLVDDAGLNLELNDEGLAAICDLLNG